MRKLPPAVTSLFLLGCGTLLLSTSFADTTSDYSFVPLAPRASALGWGGTNVFGAGDIMFPVYGNADGILFLDGQGYSAFQNEWVGSIGAGVRHTQGDDARILGAYVFADRNVSNTNTQFWFISPGVESLGNAWDFRANGYIPAGTRTYLVNSGFADQFGIYNYVTFQGHTQFDALANQYQTVGWGADAEIGRRVPMVNGMRAYLGGYHFNMTNADPINGVEGRLEYPLNATISLSVADSYDDNRGNTIEGGLRVTLGGVNKSPRNPSQPIQERMLDPIGRHLATLGQPLAEPIVSTINIIPNTNMTMERTNIWFFSPTASGMFVDGNSCTADNVCNSSQFTQANINTINMGFPNVDLTPSSPASFYLAPGGYSILTGSTPFTLTNDSVFGRSADFSQPDQAAVMAGAFDLKGTDDLEYLILQNVPSSLQPWGLNLESGSTATLTHTQVGQNSATLGYATGIQMQDATLTASGSSAIYGFTSNNTSAYGIKATDTKTAGSTITLNNSSVSARAELSNGASLPGPSYIAAAGIYTNDTTGTGSTGSTITLNGSTVDAIATMPAGAVAATPAVEVYGIVGGLNFTGGVATGTQTISLSNASIVNAATDASAATVTYVLGVDAMGQTSTISIDDSKVFASATDPNSPNIEVVGVGEGPPFADFNPTTGVTQQITLTNNSQVTATYLDEGQPLVQFAEVVGINQVNGFDNTVSITGSTISSEADEAGTVNLPQTVFSLGVAQTGNILGEENVNNTITVQGNSQVTASFSADAALAGEVDGLLQNTAAGMNSVTLGGTSKINAGSTIDAANTGGFLVNGVAMVMRGGTNTFLMENNSIINAIGNLVDAMGTASGMAINGIALEDGTGNGHNNVTLMNNSSVLARGTFGFGGAGSAVEVAGIMTETMLGGINSINIEGNSIVHSIATVFNSDPSTLVTAYGIDAIAGSSADNQITVASTATVTGQAQLNGVFLPPTPIHTSP